MKQRAQEEEALAAVSAHVRMRECKGVRMCAWPARHGLSADAARAGGSGAPQRAAAQGDAADDGIGALPRSPARPPERSALSRPPAAIRLTGRPRGLSVCPSAGLAAAAWACCKVALQPVCKAADVWACCKVAGRAAVLHGRAAKHALRSAVVRSFFCHSEA